MRVPITLLLLLISVLAGCLDGVDTDLDATEDDTGPVHTLPPGLELHGAETVEYSSTRIVWRLEGIVASGACCTGTMSDTGVERTRLDIPAGVPLALEANLSYEADHQTQLRVRVDDGQGGRICEHFQNIGEGSPVVCSAPTGPRPAPETSEVRWWSLAHPPVPVPYTLTVTMATGQPNVPTVEAADSVAAKGSTGPHVVMGFTDTGINPYHASFRDDSPEAFQHPSTYIEGYPEDAEALELSLDAPRLVDALGADAEVWADVEPGTLYWVPGTRIVGAIMPDTLEQGDGSVYFCQPVLDCYNHGTAVASRGAGIELGACPSCKIVAIQGFKEGLDWAVEQDWVDLTSNSWWYGESRVAGYRAEDAATMAVKPAFIISTNGIANAGILGTPSLAYSYQSAPEAIVVGGHDNGRVVLWPGSMPRIVADACDRVAQHTSMVGTMLTCGTSLATPNAAGTGARLLLEARRLLNDTTGGVRGDVIARGGSDSFGSGPLADGHLTQQEFRRLLYATADPRPSEGPRDGPACEPTSGNLLCLAAPATPVDWQDVPEGVPQYYFIGYGAVDDRTVDHAKRVLRGAEPMPERAVEDAFFALDQEIRKALVEVDP